MENIKAKQTNPYIIAFVALLPAFLALVATSATNVCQPNIAGYFGATQYEANTVVTCYIICGGITLSITSYLSNLFGQKQYLMYCIAVFTIGSILCILAKDLSMLIFARLIQGLGHGSILPICQATLLDAFPQEKRGIAMGMFGIAAMFSPLIGPYLGGYLTDNYSWQWVFIINIPFCILSIILIKYILPDTKPIEAKYKKKFDIIGFSSICLAMASMQIVLDKGEQFNWFDTTWICWVTGLSIFCFIFFYIWELEYKYPFIDIHDLGLSICVDPTLERGICHYNQYKNSIEMSEEVKNNPFVFAHELGHAIDIGDKKISDDYYMIWQFGDEYQDYKQKTSDTEAYAIDYFVDSPNDKSEIVAETYALLSGLPNTNMHELGLRSLTLQQHFPKTISYIAEKII